MLRTLILSFLISVSAFAYSQLSIVGAGVLLDPELYNNYPFIKQVLKFSPAEDAGLKTGEVIWAVDGKSTEGKSSKDAALMIKGTEGTVRTLEVGDDHHSVTLTLRLIKGNCTDGDCINGEGRIEEPTGDIYSGNFVNGKFDGYGMYYYYAGEHMYARYDGAFVAGKKEGEGTLDNYDGGYKYTGGFKAGVASGKGKVTFYNSETYYEGNFAADKPAGSGKLTLSDGSVQTLTPASFSDIIDAAGVRVSSYVSSASTTSSSANSGNSTQSSATDNYSSSASEDFSSALATMAKVEYDLSYALDAYANFRNVYRDALMAENAEYADEQSWNEYKKCVDYIISAVDRADEVNSAFMGTEVSERQNEALDDWSEAIGAYMTLFADGMKENPTPSDWYWLNVNIDRGREYLEQAAAARHSF